MANVLTDLESTLENIFGKKAPQLPGSAKTFMVKWAPIFAVVAGVFGLVSAIAIWNWAHHTVNLVDLAQSTCVRYGGENCAAITGPRLSFWIWLTLIGLVVQSVLYLLAYTGLKDRSKQGWDYVYYASLFSLGLAVVRLFSDYNPLGNFIGSLIVAAVGFYFLFQLREFYQSTSRVTLPNNSPTEKPVEPTPNETSIPPTEQDQPDEPVEPAEADEKEQVSGSRTKKK